MANAGARFTYMSSRKWNDPWYLSLTVRERNLFDFLCECGDNTVAGVYQCDPQVARLKTGPWTSVEWDDAVEHFAGHVIFYPDNWLWVVNYARYNCQTENRNGWVGIANVVQEAPPELASEFARRYSEPLAKHGLQVEPPSEGLEAPSKGIEQSFPIRTSPVLTIKASLTGESGNGSASTDAEVVLQNPQGKLGIGQGKRPRKLTVEQHQIVTRSALGAMKMAAKYTGLESPPNYTKGGFFGFFTERVLVGDTEDDFHAAAEIYFRRLKEKETSATAAGHPITPGGSFAHFKSSYGSILREIVENPSHAQTR